MHGKFTSNLREFAHDYAIKLKYQVEEEQQRERDQDEFRSFSGSTFTWQLKCKYIIILIYIYLLKNVQISQFNGRKSQIVLTDKDVNMCLLHCRDSGNRGKLTGARP